MEAHFDGLASKVGIFLVTTERFLHRWGSQFQTHADVVEFIAERLDGLAADWYVDLYQCDAPELHSNNLFFRALRARFGDPHLKENARTDLKQLRQGSMTVREYSAVFRSLAAKLPDWPESLLVDYYRAGLNLEIMRKAIEHADPQTLVGWIQAASEVEARIHLVCTLKQARASGGPVAT